MFKLLQRYALSSVLRSLLFTWLVLNAVVVSLMFGDKWDEILDNKATTKQAITYFACVLPQTTLVVFPAVCLMGSLFGMLALARHNELAAMFAAGASLRWLVRPAMVASFLIGAACFAWNEFVAAPLSREGEQLMITEIQKKKGIFKDYGLLRGTKKRFIRYSNFDKENAVLNGFVLHEMWPNGQGHKRLIRADVAAWDAHIANPETGQKGAWVLTSNHPDSENYVIDAQDEWRSTARPLSATGEILFLDESPGDFGIDQRPPIEMSYAELKRRISLIEESGRSALALYPDLEYKVAFPFSIVTLIFIGLASGASSFLMGREGAARFTYPLGVCLIVMAGFYGLTAVCLALGGFGMISPLLAAWTPNFVFGSLGFWMLVKT